MTSLRPAILSYVKEKYKSEIEYLWYRYPNYAVFRHDDNKKWYGIVMDVARNKLGLPGDGTVDVLNVKVDDFLLRDLLIQRDGFLAGYHISRGNWITVLLDDTVTLEEIKGLIDISFEATASKKKKKEIRPPKVWIVPANPKYYDIEHAFDAENEIGWKQGNGIKPGDTVFMYVASPVSAILYKCTVTETDIPYQFQNGALSMNALMKIRLQKRYDPTDFTFERLKDEYGILTVRGPRGIPNKLIQALKQRGLP